MSANMNFCRFDRQSEVEGFTYKSTDNARDIEYEFNSISMDKAGFNIHTVVQNYLAEPVLLGGNLRVNPTRIRSLRRDDTRPRDDFNNSVVVTIYSSENSTSIDSKRRTTLARKTVIHIPGRILNQGSVFISELDCYVMAESQLDATRELIARDVSHPGWDSINVPSSMINQNPEVIYDKYKQLAKFCIERQDKISIRIGVNLKYGNVPDIIKTMRVAILDSYFVPYSCYKLVYDPTLGADEFVIENLHHASRDEFRSTFSELHSVSAMYLDHQERETMFGTFYGMALFANEQRYVDYAFKRKSQERFRDETLFLARRSGDPLLKEEISKLERENHHLKEDKTEQTTTIDGLREANIRLKADLRDRESTIVKIRQGHDAKMSMDVVLGEVSNDARRIENDRIELENKEKAAPLLHRATMLKTIGDIMKSGWGITTACLGGVLSIAALCKKYNVKLSMSPSRV